jgi:hypothetical protein
MGLIAAATHRILDLALYVMLIIITAVLQK